MTTGFTLALYLLTRARETQHTTQVTTDVQVGQR